MRTLRASELATYLYCHRAWWFQDQGFESQNQMELAGGSAYHEQHGRQIFVAGLLRFVGYAFLLIALVVTELEKTPVTSKVTVGVLSVISSVVMVEPVTLRRVSPV